MRIWRYLLAGALAVCGLFNAACGEQEPDCDALAERDLAGTGSTAFLIDASASTGASGLGPDYSAALRNELDRAVKRGDEVAIGVFDGSAATTRWVVTGQVTRSEYTHSDNIELDEEDALACLTGWAAEAVAQPPRAPGTDVLGAIKTAAEHIAQRDPPERTVVLATDELSTVGCADLTVGPIGDPLLIEAMAAECPRRPDWPASLAGATLVMVGIGQPASGQVVPETGHVAWLQEYWQRLCLVARARACAIRSSPVPEAERDRALYGHQDPEVTYAAGAEAPVARDTTIYSVPSKVLFDTNSDQLRSEGEQHLAELAQRIRDERAREADPVVEVVGHTDSRGAADYNQDLSQRRAQSVADALRKYGISTTPPQGAGETDLLCAQERHPDGTWDQQCLQQNRRVEIRVMEGSG